MKIINTAIIGFGLSGRVFHAPFIHEHPGFQLSKVVERHRKDAQAIYHGIETIRSFEEILADESIELVVICTPNIYHYSMAKASLEAGKDIVIEKPFMPNSAKADEIIKLAEKKERNIFVYQNRRWDGDFLSLKKLLNQGTLGEIKYFESHFDRFSPIRTRAAWRDEVLAGSGILFDLGSHLIDQAYALFGSPLTIKANIQAQRKGSKVDDFFHIRMRYSSHEVVVTAGMLVKDHQLRFIIKGSKGSYTKNGLDPQETELNKGNLPKGKDWGKESSENWGTLILDDNKQLQHSKLETEAGDYMAFYQNVYEVIAHKKELAIKLSDASNVIKIIEKAFESNAKKKEIKF
ncbi:MAG: oxidoreductase [Bacteroidales bacterium]|nr:oxidoreductase [Bacteroidales bacterium]